MKKITITIGCLTLNIVLGKIAWTFHLPIFPDTIGTILAATLAHPLMAFVLAILTNIIEGFLIDPCFPYYIGTQVLIVLTVLLGLRTGLLTTWKRALLLGLIIAVLTPIVSAPVTAWYYGKVSTWKEIFILSGKILGDGFLKGALLLQGLDKFLVCVLGWKILQSKGNTE